MSSSVKSFTVLCTICVVVALLLAGVNYFTAPVIEAAQNAEVLKGLSEVYEGAEKFTPMDLTKYSNLPAGVTDAYTVDDLGGYVVKVETAGFKTGMIILVGVNSEGAVTGSKAVAHSESPGYGKDQLEGSYPSSFDGVTMDTVDAVDTVGGVTMTTNAYKDAIKTAIGATVIFGGGSFDNRTEEEIKLDEALPEAEGGFEREFCPVSIDGLTALFKAQNGKGYVLVYGEDYIGVDENGALVGTPSSAYAASAEADIARITGVTYTDIVLTEYDGIAKSVKSVKLTSEGTYVVEVEARGFDAEHADWSTTKSPIKIKLAIDSTGKVISVITLSHNESTGIGDVCAKPDYYNGFIGVDADTVGGVDTVGGATVTTTAYRTAVKNAINAVNIIVAANAQ